jgi:predicted transcriptional regulator
MNNTSYLKRNLISRIRSSNNETFLTALQTIFDSSEQELYEVSRDQRESIEAGIKDIEEGNYKTHDQVMKETVSWLKKQ